MIYTVELNFSDPGREVEWNAWYETYLTQLVSLPGLTTAQRFRALTPGTPAWAYLAIYSVASLEVFASDAYRGIGGDGQASRRFREAIRRRRNVYAGIERWKRNKLMCYCCFCAILPHKKRWREPVLWSTNYASSSRKLLSIAKK